jgi:N-acetylneuraminic acid mutarotase
LLLVLLAACPSPQPEAQRPTVDKSSQSSMSSKPGQRVTFDVTASDPEGGPLSFSWQASLGTLVTVENTETSSRALWTPPLCLPPGTSARITVTLTNAAGVSASTAFGVTGETACPAWTLTGSTGTPRQMSGMAVLPSGKVLAAGGRSNNVEDSSDWLASAEVYDPATGTWTPTGSMAAPRSRFSLTVLASGKVLAVGGYMGNQDTPILDRHLASAEVYDPATGTWTPTGSMTTPRADHLAALLPSGKVLVMGGVSQYEPTQSAELYDPATGTWSDAGTLLAPHWGHPHSVAAVTLPSGKVLVTGGGGYYEQTLSTAELYDPATNTWALTGSMTVPRGFHSASLLPSGKVLVTGGLHQWVDHPTAELYDPEAGTWTRLKEMSEARSRHTASVLPSGLVLVTGGVRLYRALSSADVYDPSTNTWTLTAAMHEEHVQHSANVLPSGQVLISGDLGDPFARMELYTLP